MVFQNYALFPHLTVAENLAFPLKVRKISAAEVEEKVNKVLDMVQMRAFGDRKPAQLSGGQQQRIALARALVFEPDLVLMDEPLGALDKQLREHMQYEIKHIHESLGVTVVYVTHDQSEALTMSNRIAVFDDGVIQQLADPVTLYEKPENAFVAQFIGENNRLMGTVRDVAKGVASVELDNGDMVKALAINIGGKGERSLLSVRPERCIVTPKKTRGMSALNGRIEELIYLGDHIRCRMNVAADDEFIVKVPNTSGQLGLQIGAEVFVGWETDDCRALDYRP
jgi:putative spermidine/putrescine transport system ATP-binding protein